MGSTHFRARSREPHHRRAPAKEPAAEPLADELIKSSIELKRELLDRTARAAFLGGTLASATPAGGTSRDTIKRIRSDPRGVEITTYLGRKESIDLVSADTELKAENGIIYIDAWPITRYALAPKGIVIPELKL